MEAVRDEVPHDGETMAEAVHAPVVERPAADRAADGVVAYDRENPATSRTLESVEFVDDLPETATGKGQEYELPEEYWEGEGRMIGGGVSKRTRLPR